MKLLKLTLFVSLLALLALCRADESTQQQGERTFIPVLDSAAKPSKPDTHTSTAPRSTVGDQYAYCGQSASYTITDNDGNFGCKGYQYGVSVTFTLSSNITRFFQLQSVGLIQNYDQVTVYYNGMTYGPYSGSSTNTLTLALYGTSSCTVTLSSSYSGFQGAGFYFTLTSIANLTTVYSGQTFSDRRYQPGGFAYYIYAPARLGANLTVTSHVLTYQGLQPPSLFLSRNTFPTLEVYDIQTSSVAMPDGTYKANLTVPNPVDGAYLIGVFLYGQSTDVDITVQWTFSVPVVNNGVKVSNNAVSDNFYQFFVPPGVPNLLFQASRELPGGYPIFYLSQGYIGTSSTAQYTLDTHINSYQSVNIAYPYNISASNPGSYLVAITGGQVSYGYIFEASWSSEETGTSHVIPVKQITIGD